MLRLTSSSFRHARLLRALVGALMLLLGFAAAPVHAVQGRGPLGPVTLTEVRLLSESTYESRFELTFTPTATTYTPSLGPPNQPGLGFALASRGPHAVQPSGMKGLVRSIGFAQEDRILIMRFQAIAAATLSAVQTGPKVVEVTVSSGQRPRENAASDTAAGGPSEGLPPGYEPPPGEDGYELVLLKYADVSEVVGLLSDGVTVKSNDLFIPSEPGFGSNSLTGGTSYNPQPATQSPGSNDEPLGQSIDASLGIDRRLNAIWLKGSPDRIARMKAMIAAIDIPVDSVVLETQFVELTESGQKALGIDFTNSSGQIGVATFGSGTFSLGLPPQGCSADGLNCSGHITSVGFQAALYAQIQKGNGRIISKPRIAAQSGSTAKIITGDAIPILTAITLSGVNGVSQQVQYVNVGVTLQIAPRVSGDGFVSSHVFAVVSSVTGSSQGYPTISQREAETSATVRDGDSFVIGGLTQDEQLNTRSKVPLLGDIPLVGQAFRTDRYTKSKTELYIIVTPHVVHRVGTSPTVVPSNRPLYAPTTTTIVPLEPLPPPPLPQAR